MLRRSIVVLLASLVMLAMAVPALAQYPPVPTTTTTIPGTTTTTLPAGVAPTCALVVEVLEVPGFLSLQGTQWAPNSNVEIEIAGIFYNVQTDDEGNFREDLLVNQDDVLAFLGDIDLTQTQELDVVCRGTDQQGDPQEVLLVVEVQFPLLNGETPEGVSCFGRIELVDAQPLLTWQGSGWEPGSTVVVSPALVGWEALVGDDGTFVEEVVITEEQLIDLFDEITGGALQCEGTGTDGEPQTVTMRIVIAPTLLDTLGLGLPDPGLPDLGLPGGAGGADDGLLGGLIELPPLPLLSSSSAQAVPVDWDPRTNGAAFVALLAMALLAIGGGDLLLWSRRRNDTTMPDGQNL